MVRHRKKRITEREKLLISNCVGRRYLTSRIICCDEEEDETGMDSLNYAENMEDVSSDEEDDDVLASDIVLADDDTLPNNDLEEITAEDDKVFVSQIIEEKNMLERRGGVINIDKGLDEEIIYGIDMKDNDQILMDPVLACLVDDSDSYVSLVMIFQKIIMIIFIVFKILFAILTQITYRTTT